MLSVDTSRLSIVTVGLALVAAGAAGGSVDEPEVVRPGAGTGSVRAFAGEEKIVIEETLGLPDAVVSNGKEETVFYGAWKLEFKSERLERSVRERRIGSGGKPSGQAIDRKVLSLKRGATKEKVEETLGKPDSYETAVINGQIAEESVFYGEWQLQFAKDRLTYRTNW